MAITYKSQGAGVSTETSGAALSPLCPATVDAGDILIAHTYWEGTASAPNTPSGWTLLDGPRVIESTIGRHWIFGKIADGTEDGAAVAFGSPAVTTMRAARVYSFAGRVSGSITDLCLGFAATSHATDPQMPSVTTTVAGALAVACVAQNDNNTAAAATGESGGDWIEAVAEYVAALTPGLMLQIQTADMATPGTISGGSVATANDPCGVIGFEIRPSVPATVVSGAAVISGAGDLVAAAMVVVLATSAQSGTGSVAVAAMVMVLAATAQSAAGSLTAAALVIELATANLPGTGDLASAGVLVVDGAAPLIGVGALQSAAVVSVLGVASLSGAGDLSATAVIEAGTPVVTGAAILSQEYEGIHAPGASAVMQGYSLASNQVNLFDFDPGDIPGLSQRVFPKRSRASLRLRASFRARGWVLVKGRAALHDRQALRAEGRTISVHRARSHFRARGQLPMRDPRIVLGPQRREEEAILLLMGKDEVWKRLA